MLDYVRQRSSSTSFSSLLSARSSSISFLILYLLACLLHGLESSPVEERASLQRIFQLRQAQTPRKLLRILYFREFDMTIDEVRLTMDMKNLTASYGIDFQLNILDQSKSLLTRTVCSIIAQEPRDTVLIADLYTKEIDLISRSLKIPTIATTNRYQLVQAKQHNPYLFKLMPDAVEEAKSFAFALDTRSLYSRIALLYDTSLDMTEYRLSYLRIAKQHIIYRAHLPRVSATSTLHRTARRIIFDLVHLQLDLILCIMSTERELQFVRLIKDSTSPSVTDLLLNRTSWWFASRLGENRSGNHFPKIYTANEDRRYLLSHFASSSMKILLGAVLRTYIRLPISSVVFGTTSCTSQSSLQQLTRTRLFIQLFTNFTEWNCDIRLGLGIDPILFEPKTLAWRVPTIFMVHTEHACQGVLTRIFYSQNANADQFFRSCRPVSYSARKSPSTAQPDQSNSSSSAPVPSNALVDISNYHQMFGKLTSDGTPECRFVQMHTPIKAPIIVGVVEPPYIFVSDEQISSDFHCNYGIPCYQIDPSLINFTTDALFFHSKRIAPPHCCYGISINLLLRMEDSNLILALKTPKLFVFSDKPNKWLALIQTLKNRRAHLAISAIPYESFLARSIDLSPPFYHSSYVILTAPAPVGPSLGAFLQPFSWTTWCMIFLVLNATALFETFFEWHSPYGLTPKGRRRQRVFSLASALTLSWSIIFSHTFKTKSPKCWSNRFLGNVWGGFGIVFIAIYTAKLAAFMVEVGETNIASNIHGIVDVCRKTPRCTVGVVANTSDEEYLKRFYTDTLYRQIKYVSSYTQGIDLLRSREITYLLMDHSMARYYLTRDVFKLIRISGDNFGTFGLALGFSKFEGALKDNITSILLSYIEKGIIQRLHDDWYVYENCETKRLNENRVLSVDRFFGVFILLVAGMLVGLIILLLEWMTFKYAVPYWRRRRWPGWMFCSQRLYAVLNVTDDVFDRAYCSSKDYSFKCVGERLHNHSTRSGSLDLRVVNVPKLLCTTYELKEQMKKFNEQQDRHEPLFPSNGNLPCSSPKKDTYDESKNIRARIYELEEELHCLRSRLTITPTPKNS